MAMLEFIRQATLFIWGVIMCGGGMTLLFVAGTQARLPNEEENSLTAAGFGMNVLVWGSLIYSGVYLLRTVFAA